VTFPLYVEVDQIYNLACPASPIHYQHDPVATTKTSVHGAINMLGLAKRTKARILQASTSEVYGDPEVHPQPESYWGRVNPVGIRSCYDEGKRCAETLFFDYHRQNKVDIRVVRIFNTYGPNMHPNDGRVVSNFIVQALKGEEITLYGDPLVHPQPESYWGNVNPIGPRGVYDEAKRFAEAITMAYHRFHGVSTRIVRIFNTYGPRMRARDGRVVPAFICQALAGQPLTVFGDGSQTRSFCYVDDLIEGIVRVLFSELHEPVNIGNPAEMTVLQFAEAIRRLTGNHLPIEFRPLPVDDPKVRQPDITLARTRLGWEPKVPLEVGIGRTIEYFRSRVGCAG